MGLWLVGPVQHCVCAIFAKSNCQRNVHHSTRSVCIERNWISYHRRSFRYFLLKESVSLPVKRGVSQLYIFGTGCSLGEKHSISLIYTFPKRWMDGWMDGWECRCRWRCRWASCCQKSPVCLCSLCALCDCWRFRFRCLTSDFWQQ